MPFQMVLIGNFPTPAQWSSPSVEAKAMFERAFWSPSITDFKAVSGGTTVVGTFVQFLEQIEKHTSRTIEWISFISHGNMGNIAFGGRIDLNLQDVIFTDTLVSGNLINTPLAQRVEKLRDRFTQDAQIDFYLCNAGANVGLLKEIADAFQVRTRGFSRPIYYCPEVDKIQPSDKVPPRYQIRNRRRVSSDSSCSTVKPSIFLLTPDRLATPKRLAFP